MAKTPAANRKNLLIALSVGAVAVLIVLLRFSGGDARNTAPAVQAAENGSTEDDRIRGARLSRAGTEKDRKPARDLSIRSSETSPPVPAATPAPEEHATVESKRQFRSDNFENPQTSLEGFKLVGLVRTPEGIALAPKKPGEAPDPDGEIRKGVLESPPLRLDFPSNFQMPLWRHKATEGSGLTVEMAISPEGQNWSRWFALEPNSDEISPTYPDGSPNPNYGFQGGTGIANGTRLYGHAKYRVTMTSGDANESPVLQEFKIYYVDSAGPDGVIAERPYTGAAENP